MCSALHFLCKGLHSNNATSALHLERDPYRLWSSNQRLCPLSNSPATIEDVARIAEVSIATVSRAIHLPEKVA
ncbi:LacI family DNA-binding transcriptional regulator, partial [Cypionkella sp.]|uniref:LacI family DNA-binding transcriptional regulator n=1 Tax=Cypionkella sp. TaxID=2811411 RepID=UPI0039FC609F